MMVTILLRLYFELVKAHRFDLAVVPRHRARPVGLEGN